MNRIAIGSTNPVKIQAVKNAIENGEVIGFAASSNVRTQPLSEEETRQGAICRAKNCLEHTNADVGIGLEAGVFFLDAQVYLCHWGALVDRNENMQLTNGPIILLPPKYRKDLLAGQDLETIMHQTTGIQNLGSKGGAIAIFTGNRLNREQMLTEMVKVLISQYQYYQK